LALLLFKPTQPKTFWPVPCVVGGIIYSVCFVDNKRLGDDCLQCFDTVVWASGRASGLQRLSDEVLVWLSVWSEVQIVASQNYIISCLIKIQTGFIFLVPAYLGCPGKEAIKQVLLQ